MTVKFSETIMTSNATQHYAQADGNGGWTASWLPKRTLTYAQAITAMMIAEAVKRLPADEMMRHADPAWVHFDGWAAELGIAGPGAVVAASLPLEDHGMPPAPAAGDRAAGEPAVVKFTVTTAELGRQTKVMISAHDTIFEAPPFDVASFTVPVRGCRPREDAMQYFAEIVAALNRAIRDKNESAPSGPTDPSSAIAHLLTPLPFGAES